MNQMKIEFSSLPCNEIFARTAGVAFVMNYNPTVDEVMEIKTILAEAIVNCIIHGYNNQVTGLITLMMEIDEQRIVTIEVIDQGKGIKDIDQARQPLYTSRLDLERSGMGMTIMETFSDDFEIKSEVGVGTHVKIIKKLRIHE